MPTTTSAEATWLTRRVASVCRVAADLHCAATLLVRDLAELDRAIGTDETFDRLAEALLEAERCVAAIEATLAGDAIYDDSAPRRARAAGARLTHHHQQTHQ